MHNRGFILVILLCTTWTLVSSQYQLTTDTIEVNIDGRQRDPTSISAHHRPKESPKQPLPCRVILAPSSIPGAGLGVFTLEDIPKFRPILPGDIVVQIPDIERPHDLHTLLHYYLWDSQVTGGFYEGFRVVSFMAGLGTMANAGLENRHNALPLLTPAVDEAGLTRQGSPTAGAITHYHNMTFFSRREIGAGEEILIDYGKDHYQERVHLHYGTPQPRSMEYLYSHGMCVDNIKPGKSTIPLAGRGAFATRFLPEGIMVSPVPLIPVGSRQALNIWREKEDGTITETQQLLLNYCIGHPESSLLFLPLAPGVNLINHGDGPAANVRLRWSEHTYSPSSGDTPLSLSFEDVRVNQTTGLMLEMVATRPIRPGEEILLDYGTAWKHAFENHVANWEPDPSSKMYAPSYVHNDVVRLLRNETELRHMPYPDNVFTSVYYRYSIHKEHAEKDKNIGNTITTYRWNMTRDIFDLRNLRPCSVLQREEDHQGKVWYTVRVLNRYNLDEKERIPKGTLHIITHVPRQALRFNDKIFTTDQHQKNTFRQEIGFPDDLFPIKWRDLQ